MLSLYFGYCAAIAPTDYGCTLAAVPLPGLIAAARGISSVVELPIYDYLEIWYNIDVSKNNQLKGSGQMTKQSESQLVDNEVMVNLVSQFIYFQFIRFGRHQSLNQIKQVLLYEGYEHGPTIEEAYAFTCDLYDENESNGNNDEMYPYRKK